MHENIKSDDEPGRDESKTDDVMSGKEERT